MGRTQHAKTVNEAGLYELIFQSRVEGARKFKRWVTSEVLPAIRKTGSYSLEVPRTLPDALRAYAMEVEKSAALEAKVQEDAPKVEAFEQFLGAAGDLDLRETAQSLDLGRTRLADFLRRQGFFSPGSTTPYQRFVDRGWFRPVTRVSQRPEGPKAYQVTLVTPAGREAIRERLEATRSNLVAVV